MCCIRVPFIWRRNLIGLRIRISREVWNEVISVAREAKERGEKIRAFFLYSKRGDPLLVVRAKEVPVRIIKESSPSGMIFRWNYPRDRYREYYPKKGPDRYSGTLLVKPDLSMSLHYAYWMGVDFPGGSGGFNINLWLDDEGRPIYRAFYVHRDKTNGEFVEVPVEIVGLR